ncbi:MAG: hypothetical protein R6U98_12830, partial [Pirellulaceae bacterium]
VPDMDQDEFAEWFQSLDDSVPRNNADQLIHLIRIVTRNRVIQRLEPFSELILIHVRHTWR